MKTNLAIYPTDAQLVKGLKIPGRFLALMMALLFVWRFCAAGVPVPDVDEVPFELMDGYLVVVKGSLPGLDRRVNVLIDTGATATFVNRKLARTAGLRNLPPMGITSTAFGSPVDVERVLLGELRLGRRVITRSCLAADLLHDDIDVILGLDILRGTSLTIDYENSRVVFGAPSSKEQSAGLEEEEGLLVVPVIMDGKTMRMAVDTGSHLTLVYQRSWTPGNTRSMDEELVKITHSAGSMVARQFTLFDLQIGEARIGRTALAVLAVENDGSNIDGFLGMACLGLKRIYVDFQLQTLLIEA